MELDDKIDVQCLCPGVTRTNLLKENSKKNPIGLSAKACAQGSLRDLGYPLDYMTSGNIRHDIQSFMLTQLSKLSIMQYITSFAMTTLLKN